MVRLLRGTHQAGARRRLHGTIHPADVVAAASGRLAVRLAVPRRPEAVRYGVRLHPEKERQERLHVGAGGGAVHRRWRDGQKGLLRREREGTGRAGVSGRSLHDRGDRHKSVPFEGHRRSVAEEGLLYADPFSADGDQPRRQEQRGDRAFGGDRRRTPRHAGRLFDRCSAQRHGDAPAAAADLPDHGGAPGG